MNTKKITALMTVSVLLCSALCACGDTDEAVAEKSGAADESTLGDVTEVISQESTDSAELQGSADIGSAESETSEPETSEPEQPEVMPIPVDIETDGGVVIVGKIGIDDGGWYIEPEQPLNITFEYFLGSPSVFAEQTRISMFDPKLDGFEKAVYIGQTVTAEGTFRFYRDDFETLYFAPYTVTIGKTVPQSCGAPELLPPDEPIDRYDPSVPLPTCMEATAENGSYVYNPYMLSIETLEYMGNGFAEFYVGFVDAVLNYETEYPCADREYAEMLSTVIYYEFPLYNACAEPFEFFRHYDEEKGTVNIVYRYEREEHERIVAEFFDAANTFLANASPDRSDTENAKNIYNALCTRMTYDHSAMVEFERKESYYAYLHNSGVCLTFANAYNQLLTCAGIETTIAHCDSDDTVGHSWSVVTLDGQKYFCDPTYELNYDNGGGYRYFGMNYADRTANGLGADGIRCGRYYLTSAYPEMIAEKSLKG